MTAWPPEVTLSGQAVRLEPLSQTHATALGAAVGDLHKLWYTTIPAPDRMETEITRRRDLANMQPFAICTPDGTAIGMTTYMNIDPANRRLEIGSTWISQSVQKSGINTEAKFLLLRHAFEALECIAVEFRTHAMNRQSRDAIERLGAKQDGLLRAHMIMANGTLRDTAVYSITAPEWPAVKANLEHKLLG